MKKIQLIVVVSFLLFAIIVLGMLIKAHYEQREILECGPESPGGISFFIIDASDALEKLDTEIISKEIQQYARSAEDGTKIIILQPNADAPFSPTVKFEKCTNWQNSFIGYISNNGVKKKIIDSNERAYLAQLDNSIAQTFKSGLAVQSPLIETIIYISKTYDFVNSKNRRIFLYSDMFQNSDRYTFYKKQNLVVPTVYEKINLDSSVVKVNRSFRFKSKIRLSKSQINRFWREWITSSNGRLELISQ